MDFNVYQPPKSTGPKTRAWTGKYLALTAALTLIAATLCQVSINVVRILLPNYPQFIAVGPYRPLRIVHIFHSVGTPGLVIAFLAACVAAVVSRRFELPRRLPRAGAVVHLAFLGSAIVAYGFCLWRISRLLERIQ